MSSPWVWMHDELVPAKRALVPISDRSFTSGDGVFEAIKVTGGHPFALTRHLMRLERSASAIGIDLPPQSRLREAVRKTIAANADFTGPDARVRITVTAGEGIAGPIRSSYPTRPTIVATSDPLVPPPQTAIAITVPWIHNERAKLVGAKTTSYAENLSILEDARRVGADEALIADSQGRLAEGMTSNVYVVIDGELITPSLETGCLGGVTRELILEWGIARVEDVLIKELGSATEVLLSSSTRDLLPISQLDGRTLSAPGPVGARAIAAFAAKAATKFDP